LALARVVEIGQDNRDIGGQCVSAVGVRDLARQPVPA
tara:strand:- start:577 stop:687 length:111 start_codon:yes stop_codon:yes gene_type:complete